ncbi:methionine--tRNA ligase [Patescibacteria group bacterium]|nr:methionine--tRNA ligase [Patescibacteria group bacterium]
MNKKETFYITTAIHYANAGPHMGHAYEGVITDIIARYKRNNGFPTFFLSGTDEHGDKILRAAQKENVAPQIFVNNNAQKFKDLYKKMELSNDDFIRTSDSEKHWPGVIKWWKNAEKKGDIYKAVYKGKYCVGCESFITEKELMDGKCPYHNKEPEIIEEENFFFKLSKYAPQIQQLIQSDEIKIIPNARKKEMITILEEGIKDISCSRPERDIIWGIPVPNNSGQTIYVWTEALINYISALGYGSKKEKLMEQFWPANVHIVGKDIFRFHAIVWPAMLLSAGLPMPKTILVHGFVTSQGRKMSKSIGNVVDPEEYIDAYGADAFRYFVAREISPFEDGDFTKEKFIETYNANLANGLGNLVSRTLKMAEQYFDGKIERRLDIDTPLQITRETLTGMETLKDYSIPYIVQKNILPDYVAKMDKYDIQNAADTIWRLVGLLDGYITDYEPFKLIKEDKNKTENILWNVLYGIYWITQMVAPILPDTAEKITKALGVTVSNTVSNNEPISFQTECLDKPLFVRVQTEK